MQWTILQIAATQLGNSRSTWTSDRNSRAVGKSQTFTLKTATIPDIQVLIPLYHRGIVPQYLCTAYNGHNTSQYLCTIQRTKIAACLKKPKHLRLRRPQYSEWDVNSTHWENYFSISFHIEWDLIVVTVFFSILNQMEFHSVQNRKENSHHDHIPFNLNGNRMRVFSVQRKQGNWQVVHFVLYFFPSIKFCRKQLRNAAERESWPIG